MKAPTLNRRMSGIDAAFIYLERKEIPLHIAGVCIFEGPIPFEELVHAIESRLHLLPRYRQIVNDPPFHLGYPTWEDAPDFDIRRHIFHVAVDPPGGDAQLEALSSRILTQVMDRRKPLWDIYVVDGLSGGRGALIARVHHSLADGVAGASLIKVMLDGTPERAKRVRKPRVQVAAPDGDHSLADAVASAVRSSIEGMIAAESVMMDFAQTLFDTRAQEAFQKLPELLPEIAAASERFCFNKQCSGERLFRWTDFSFDEVHRIREAAGGTINDVLLAILTRAFSQYIELHGEPVKGRFLRVMCPVNVRRDDQGESLGNQISFLPVALPLGIRNPMELLRAVSVRTDIMKNVRAAHLVALLAAWLGSTPPPVQSLIWNTLSRVTLPLPLLNVIWTNVPGSPTPLYALGRKMIAFYPHVPTGYELGVNCAVKSYNGRFYCGLTADAHVVADAGRLRDLVQSSFRELRRAAGVRTTRVTKPKPKPMAATATA